MNVESRAPNGIVAMGVEDTLFAGIAAFRQLENREVQQFVHKYVENFTTTHPLTCNGMKIQRKYDGPLVLNIDEHVARTHQIDADILTQK